MRVYYIGTKTDDHRPMDIEGELHELQELVHGYIEPVHLPEFEQYGILLLANEQGLLTGLEPNWNLFPYFFVGPMVAISTKDDDFAGLSEGQEEFMEMWFKANRF